MAEYFPVDPPAQSAPFVQLPRGLRLSIEAIAVVPGASEDARPPGRRAP